MVADHGRMLRILHDVNLAIGSGERFGVVGETGCGKTLTARSIIRLLPDAAVAEGRISVDGVDILRASREELNAVRRQKVAYIPQNAMTALDPLFNIGTQMKDLLPKELGDGEKRTRCSDALASVGLGDRVLRLRPHELSGGMSQRVLIAMSIIRRPNLIIADEVTTAIDLVTRAKIMDLLVRVTEERSAALLMISHDIKVIREVCTRMAVMYLGRVVEEGPVQKVTGDPKHPYTASLLKAIPVIGGEGPIPIPGVVPSFGDLPTGCVFHTRCAQAFDRCRTEDPRVSRLDDREVKCHLYE